MRYAPWLGKPLRDLGDAGGHLLLDLLHQGPRVLRDLLDVHEQARRMLLQDAVRHAAGTTPGFFFKQKTAYEIPLRLVGSEMCIRDSTDSTDLLLVV